MNFYHDQTDSQENNDQIIDEVLEDISEVLETIISILDQQTVIEERWIMLANIK
ncbi:1357_t:CDS:2 [Ambispora leptoticha]|uniref:1357_t:CDS:1 n=1 Tax=Ambispora leptoticha TaxID=144679 RepID=A0A9N9B1Z9_9GLOM|nr:1357_t:CDS:2 [Ambispora leptoticha]